MKPAISIIVPVHNLEPYLKKCIESILAQSFTDFEVILINDGSTDHSGVICDQFARNDNRVRVVHKEYGGVSSARNAGIMEAKGDFIGFVDGDDYIEKDMYKELYKLCIETNSEISICRLGREIDGKLINKDGKGFVKEMDRIEGLRQLFKGVLFRFSLCNKLFKRKCFVGIQFPEGRIHEDLSTTYKLFANADKTIFTNKIGYIYVKRKNSILTSRFNEKRLDSFLGWEEILTFMGTRYPQLSEEYISCFVYWCIDNVYYILGQVGAKEVRKEYLSSIQHHLRSYYKDIIKNGSLSLKYKCTVTLISLNFKLLFFIRNMGALNNVELNNGSDLSR